MTASNSETNKTTGGESPKDSMEIPADQVYQLLRFKALGELKEDLLSWGKKRFWLVATIFVLISAFGAPAIVRQLLDSEIRDATRATVRAQEAAKRTTRATQEAATQAEAYAKEVTSLREKAKQVDTQFLALRKTIEAESENAKARTTRESKELMGRVNRLEALVSEVAKQSEASTKALAQYEQEKSKQSESARLIAETFEENAKHLVSVYYDESTDILSDKIVAKLRNLGFIALKFKFGVLLGSFLGEPQAKPQFVTSPGNSRFSIVIEYTSDSMRKAQELHSVVTTLAGKDAEIIELRQLRLSPPLMKIYKKMSIPLRKQIWIRLSSGA